MVTLKDVAAYTGVHYSTVSRALDPAKSSRVNPETRERVRAAAEELGFRVDVAASGLRRGKSFAIGVITADLSNPFAAPIIRGIENNLDGRGYLAYITETQDDVQRLSRVLDHLLSRRVDAIICLASRAGVEPLLKRAAKQVPVVLAVRDLPGCGLPGVVHDDERGGRLVANHLADLGHRRVAQLAGPQDISSFADRRLGFEAAAHERGMTVLPLREAAERPDIADGQRLTDVLLGQPGKPPTAIFAHNDVMALGVIDRLRSAGLRVPEDVSVVGYNDSPLTGFTNPPLSTVALPGYELGRFAAEMAGSLIEGAHLETSVLTLPPRLVIRASTAAVTTPAKGSSASR